MPPPPALGELATSLDGIAAGLPGVLMASLVGCPTTEQRRLLATSAVLISCFALPSGSVKTPTSAMSSSVACSLPQQLLSHPLRKFWTAEAISWTVASSPFGIASDERVCRSALPSPLPPATLVHEGSAFIRSSRQRAVLCVSASPLASSPVLPPGIVVAFPVAANPRDAAAAAAAHARAAVVAN